MTSGLRETATVQLTRSELASWAAITRSLSLPSIGPRRPLFHPVPPRPAGARSFELAPGVWIHHAGAWQPVSVLEHNSDLPAPQVDRDQVGRRRFPHPEWHDRAACRTVDSETFFGDDSERAHPTLTPTALAAARAICFGRCSEARTCLTWALTESEEYGVWAGTSGRQREKLQLRIRAGEQIQDLVDEALGAGRP